MNLDNTFREVLDILKIHGHEIMMAFYGDEQKAELKKSCTPEKWVTMEHELMYYSCYEGGEFLPTLFGLKGYNRYASFEKLSNVDVPHLKQNHIYHCELHTGIAGDDGFGANQVHYFTIFYSDVVVLLQTYGGVDGILVKYVHSDINDILNEIMNGSGEDYRRLFEIPSDMEHVLDFDVVTLKYVKQPLMVPTLQDLDDLLQTKDLGFAMEKIDYHI